MSFFYNITKLYSKLVIYSNCSFKFINKKIVNVLKIYINL